MEILLSIINNTFPISIFGVILDRETISSGGENIWNVNIEVHWFIITNGSMKTNLNKQSITDINMTIKVIGTIEIRTDKSLSYVDSNNDEWFILDTDTIRCLTKLTMSSVKPITINILAGSKSSSTKIDTHPERNKLEYILPTSLYFVNSTTIQCTTSTDLAKIETDISCKINFTVYTNDLLIVKSIHVCVMFSLIQHATILQLLKMITIKILLHRYVGCNLIFSSIITIINSAQVSCTIIAINQTEKVVIYLKIIHLPNNAGNIFSRSNIVLEHFVTEEATSITPHDGTFNITNEPITNYGNHFRLSWSLSCIYNIGIYVYITQNDTIEDSHKENKLYKNLSEYNMSIKYDIGLFGFGNISQSITFSRSNINQNLKLKSQLCVNIINNVGINNLYYSFNMNMSLFDLSMNSPIMDDHRISCYLDKLYTTHTRISKMKNQLVILAIVIQYK